MFNAYIPQDDGVDMLPEEIEKNFFKSDKSNTNRKTRKLKRVKSRNTRKRNK